MDLVLHAYCGLYCGACPILLNTKAGTGTEQCHGCKYELAISARCCPKHGVDPTPWDIGMAGGTGAALALCELRRGSFVVGWDVPAVRPGCC